MRYVVFINASEQGQQGIRHALANVRLRKLTLAQFVSLSGDFMAILAVLNVVTFRLHGSPAEVSGILIA